MSFKKLAISKLAGALGLLLALSLVLISTPAAAVPQMAHVFYGTVTDEGEAVAQGTTITARVAGLVYTTTVDAQGRYGYVPPFEVPADDPDTPGIEGASPGNLIDFYIAEDLVDTYAFAIGGYTELNLSVGEAALFTAEAGGPYSGIVEATIALSGSASGGTAPYTYAWDLDNDGTYETPGKDVSHSWSTAATYTIGLEVTDNVSATATDTAKVTVTVTAFDPYIYDADKDGEFSKAETLAAVQDYLDGIITKDEALEVVKLYFS